MAQPVGIAGREVGAAFREVIARRMTPAQIGEAQRLAREWKPSWCGIVRSVVREQRCGLSIPKIMSSSNHISTLYREFADALRDVLAENAVGLAGRGRLARTRAAVKKHPDYSEHGADDSDGGEDTLVRAANLIGQLGDPTTFWIVWS